MRILIIPSWYPTDKKPNSGIFFKEQAIALKKSGVDVMVAFPEIYSMREFNPFYGNRGFSYNLEDGLMTYRYKGYNFLPKLPKGLGEIFYKKLKSIFVKLIDDGKKPDLIHAHSVLWGGYAAAKIAKEYNIPLIVTEHSTAFLRGTISKKHVIYIKETLEFARKVVVVGPGLKKEIQKYTDKNKVIYIPNIVNISQFKPIRKSKSDKFRFFSLGFLLPKKGFDVLLKSFARSFKDNEDVELVIGGDGQESENLKKQAHSLGIENQVTFLGELSRNRAIQEMQQCDAFVLASRFETFGVVFIEALACGKPIIATSCGGPEVIVNENNGILVEVEDVIGLSNALKEIKNNIAKFNVNKIRRDCEEKYSEEAVSRELIQLYKKNLSQDDLNEF